jgi:type II secretory pathway component PulF
MASDSRVRNGEAGPGAWLLASASAALLLVASVSLAWLLWRYVPSQAALLSGLQVSLPLLTRVVIAASAWFVRLLPLLVLVGLPILGLAAGIAVLVAFQTRSTRRFLGFATACAITLSVAEMLASAVVVYAMHQALEQARPSAGEEAVQDR